MRVYPGTRLDQIMYGRALASPGAARPRIATDYSSAAPTVSATAHQKGAWTELVTALADDCYGIWLSDNNGNLNLDYLYDIGIGAAGSEVVVVSNFLMSTQNTSNWNMWGRFIPIFLPRGSRVAMRAQNGAGGASAGGFIGQYFERRSLTALKLRSCQTYGADTSDSGGTSVDPGASINTKGAYSQLVASTSKRVREIMFAIGNQRNTNRTSYTWQLDIAIGGAGSEVVIINDLHLIANATNDMMSPGGWGPFPVDIPAGTRIAARALCSGNDATDRLFDVAGYGFSE